MRRLLACLLIAGSGGIAAADDLSDALAASALGDCDTAIPLFQNAVAAPESPVSEIEATHGLALCIAGGEESWQARELMANLLPKVLAHYGPSSLGLARHHALWAEAEVRAGALNVAWRRSEAAIGAYRTAGRVDPFDHASEFFRLGAIQLARGEGDAFLAFLSGELGKTDQIDWSADGDGELFLDAIGTPPAPGDSAALTEWVRTGLEEFDPRPLYTDLLSG